MPLIKSEPGACETIVLKLGKNLKSAIENQGMQVDSGLKAYKIVKELRSSKASFTELFQCKGPENAYVSTFSEL